MAASGDPCVSLEMAKAHLRVVISDDDDLIQFYLENAQRLIIDRLERATTDTQVLATIEGWDEDTTPGAIKAAVLIQLGELYGLRGDQNNDVNADHGRLSQRVERFLGSWLERPLA